MKEIRMSLLNEDKKLIEKNVPENLVSFYLKSGWKIVEETRENIKNSSFQYKTSKREDNEE